jgi:(p)ppGpp synthase/HD superfamily hydrolase
MMRVGSEAAKMAAALHDVVEDTDVTLAQLAEWGYPAEVVEAVDALTKRPGESYPAFVERCRKCPLAREVKRADLEDNMDLRRLPEATERDMRRAAKYHRAWLRLKKSI